MTLCECPTHTVSIVLNSPCVQIRPLPRHEEWTETQDQSCSNGKASVQGSRAEGEEGNEARSIMDLLQGLGE